MPHTHTTYVVLCIICPATIFTFVGGYLRISNQHSLTLTIRYVRTFMDVIDLNEIINQPMCNNNSNNNVGLLRLKNKNIFAMGFFYGGEKITVGT